LASHPVNAKNNLIHKFFGKRLALSILSGSIHLDNYRIWTSQYFSGLNLRYLTEISARWLRQLSSGVLRDFAVDPAATTRQATLVLSMKPVPRMNKFIWKNQVYETGTDIFNFPEGTSAVQLKGQSLDKNYP